MYPRVTITHQKIFFQLSVATMSHMLIMIVGIGIHNLQDGLARLEKRRRWIPKESLEELEKAQKEAREKRCGMWEYGDVDSDDEDSAAPPARKAAGKR